MIRIHANLVVRVLDGFTGRVPAPSSIRWTMDGQPYRPIAKEDGYYILTNLSPGEHELVLWGRNYLSERLIVSGGEQCQELLITMKPGRAYPFGQAVTWLNLQVSRKKQTLPGQRVWIAIRNPLLELRIAQDTIKAGERMGKCFFPASARTLALPRDMLLIDDAKSEICRLEELEEMRFAAPLQYDHKRSKCLYPAQCHTADETGMIRAVFREPAQIEMLPEGEKKPVSLELSPGNNEYVLAL